MTKDERVWAEIDLDALAHNMRQIRVRVNKNTAAMAIVKADGYGHGAAAVSRVFLENGANGLGVATCDEGVALRKSGVTAPIMLLGFTTAGRFGDVVRHDFIQTVYSVDMAEDLSREAAAQGRVARAHVKVDTGMSRLGFAPDEVSAQAVKKIAALPNLAVEGIFTHFAQSDGADQRFTRRQADRFRHFTALLALAGVDIPVKHVSNSGAIIACEDLQMDMVRAGIMLYGLPPSAETGLAGWDLRRALSWKARVAFVKTMEKNVSVGYGRNFYTKESCAVATIPVGYADGFSRALSNRGRVLVGGEFAPVVGNVCMDQFMADVSGAGRVRPGDEVVLIGAQGSRAVTADDMAAQRGTINYEVVCGISKRVPRIYIKNNEFVGKVNGIVCEDV